MVADELPAETVIDQPGVAVRAGQAEAAGAAERKRRIAAAIEEEQGLLAAFKRSPDRARERWREVRPRRRPLAAKTDRRDRRHALAAETLQQSETMIAAAAGVHLGLERRRRRGQHHRNAGNMAAHHRHVAGVVAN